MNPPTITPPRSGRAPFNPPRPPYNNGQGGQASPPQLRNGRQSPTSSDAFKDLLSNAKGPSGDNTSSPLGDTTSQNPNPVSSNITSSSLQAFANRYAPGSPNGQKGYLQDPRPQAVGQQGKVTVDRDESEIFEAVQKLTEERLSVNFIPQKQNTQGQAGSQERQGTQWSSVTSGYISAVAGLINNSPTETGDRQGKPINPGVGSANMQQRQGQSASQDPRNSDSSTDVILEPSSGGDGSIRDEQTTGLNVVDKQNQPGQTASQGNLQPDQESGGLRSNSQDQQGTVQSPTQEIEQGGDKETQKLRRRIRIGLRSASSSQDGSQGGGYEGPKSAPSSPQGPSTGFRNLPNLRKNRQAYHQYGVPYQQQAGEPDQEEDQEKDQEEDQEKGQAPEQQVPAQPSQGGHVNNLFQNIRGAGQHARGFVSGARGVAKTAKNITKAVKTAAAAARAAVGVGQAIVSGLTALLSNPVGWVILIIVIVLIIVIIVVILLSVQSNSTAATNEVARDTIETSINSSIFTQFGPSIGRNVQVPLVANSDGVDKDSSDAVRKIYVRVFHQLSSDSKVRDYRLALTVGFPNSLNLLTPDGKVIDRNSSILTFNVKGVNSFTTIGNDTLRWECSSNCKTTDIEIAFTNPIDLASSGGQILLSLTALELKDQNGTIMPNTYKGSLCYDITNVAGCGTSPKYTFASSTSGSVSGSVSGSGMTDTSYSSDGVLQVCPMRITINTNSIVCTSGMKDKRGTKDHNAVDIASTDNKGFLMQDVVSPVTGKIMAMSDPKSELRIGGRWYQIQDIQRPEYIYVIAHLQPNTEPQGKAFDKGTIVRAGQILGKPFYATSGYDRQYWTEPHIHFQVKRNGQPIDPAPAIREKCSWQKFICPN